MKIVRSVDSRSFARAIWKMRDVIVPHRSLPYSHLLFLLQLSRSFILFLRISWFAPAFLGGGRVSRFWETSGGRR